jgi:bile acid-coenzyme A ligase
MGPPRLSFGRRLGDLAARRPDQVVLHHVTAGGESSRWTRGDFDRLSNRLARRLSRLGVAPGDMVVIGLPNTPEHLAVAHAAWKLGAAALPISARSPVDERTALLDLAAPAVVVADWPEAAAHPVVTPEALVSESAALDDRPLPDRVSSPGKAIGSGGSTGRPKLIVDPNPWAFRPGELVERFGVLGFRSGQRQLLAGPLYHNAPFLWAHFGLFEEGTLVLMERFDAARAVDLIERERIEWCLLVPTMMRRMALLPGVRERDLGSLEAVYHTAGPCPPWVKRAWIDLVGAERVVEAYGSTENVGAAFIRGDDWLRHPGSVGRPLGCRFRVQDAAGRSLPPGEVGEIWSRPDAEGPTFLYRGSPPVPATADGFRTVGDLGWLDSEGYLYLADRRVDLIVSGGANVYPLEVEAALSDHPAVADVAVIGLPDPEWGKRVHAVIQPDPGAPAPAAAELAAHCRKRLSPYKVPKSFELVAALPRNEAGKLRRELLVQERTAADDGGQPGVLA